MLTIFSTPKAFRGHTSVIQRNAIRSWTLLHPDCEVILIGDDEGTAEAARELGVRHEAKLLRNEYGTPYLNYIFDRAQKLANHDLLCYLNADIILMSDFMKAVERARRLRERFLLVGRRWDVDIREAWNFSQPGWEGKLRSLALESANQRPPDWIDLFAFTKGAFPSLPPFVIGRAGWDNWFIWNARVRRKLPVIDASNVVMPVHQNHDYSHHPEGVKGVYYGEEARKNYELIGGRGHIYTIENATHILTETGIKPNLRHWLVLARRTPLNIWHAVLGITRSIRHSLGLRQENVAYFMDRIQRFISHGQEKN